MELPGVELFTKRLEQAVAELSAIITACDNNKEVGIELTRSSVRLQEAWRPSFVEYFQ